MNAPRFALIGAAGFVAPRHLEAIKSVGGRLVAALDPHDAVGVLDRYDRDTEFFTEPERFERHLEMLRREGNPVDWVSICSPNYLHDAHIRMGLRAGARVICEKPLVIEPKNLDALVEIEHEERRHDPFNEDTRRIFTVLQLRHMPRLQQLRERHRGNEHANVEVYYSAPRGQWYQRSWKGSVEKSGGLVMNIGVHLLDLLAWIWGPVDKIGEVMSTAENVSAHVMLERANVEFDLSIDGDKPARTMIVDGESIDFTTGFEGLHNTVYAETLAGRGHGIEDAQPAIELAYRLRQR